MGMLLMVCNPVAGRPQFRSAQSFCRFCNLEMPGRIILTLQMQLFAALQHNTASNIRENGDTILLSTTPIDNIVIRVTTQRDPCWTDFDSCLYSFS